METLKTLNFRDLGGLRVADGRRLRPRRLFRSEGPASLSASQQADLQRLAFRRAFDLRTALERESAPNRWMARDRLTEVDIAGDVRSEAAPGWRATVTMPSPDTMRAAMRSNYAHIPNLFLPRFASLVRALVARETPLLVYCTAGKDRTGVVVALLLKALGVTDEDIRRDYLRSKAMKPHPVRDGGIIAVFEQRLGSAPSPDVMAVIMDADEAYLDAALDALVAGWDGIEGYCEAAGLTLAERLALRAELVV